MRYEITRSYSKTIQEKQYEPASYFASWKAITEGTETEEELKAISDNLAERCEDEVLSKIDPQKVVSRRQSMAELRSKFAQQEKKIKYLEESIMNTAPFN